MNSRHRAIGLFLALLVLLSYFLLGAESRELQQEQNSIGTIGDTNRQRDEESFLEKTRNIRSPLQVSSLEGESHVAPRVEDAPISDPQQARKTESKQTGVADENWLERGPDWKKAFGTWGMAWHFHVYLFATIFQFISIYAAYWVTHNARDDIRKNYLSISLNVLMFLFGSTRAFVLFFDPYYQGDLIDNWKAMYVLWSLGGPCLTSAGCLLIFALAETNKITLAPPKLQKFKCVVSVILGHFFLVLLTDSVVLEFVDAKPMLVFCQSFFVCWGSFLGLGYLVLAYKLDRKLFAHKTKDKNEKLYIYLIYASGAANFFLIGIFVYSSIGVLGVYSSVSHVDAWLWWTLQTFLRVSEAVSCVLVFTVEAKCKIVLSAVQRAEQCETDDVNQEVACLNTERDLENVQIEIDASDDGTSQPRDEEILDVSSTAGGQPPRKVFIFTTLLRGANKKRADDAPSALDEYIAYGTR